jgi:hypothetical protein
MKFSSVANHKFEHLVHFFYYENKILKKIVFLFNGLKKILANGSFKEGDVVQNSFSTIYRLWARILAKTFCA